MRAPPPGVTLLPWQGSPRPRPCSTSCALEPHSRLPLCRPASIRRQRSFRDDGLRRWSYAGHTQLKRQPASTQQGNHLPPPRRHGTLWRVGQSSACAYFSQFEMGKAHCNAFCLATTSRKHTRAWAREPARGGGLRGLRGTFWFVPQSCFHAEWGRRSSRRPLSASDPPSQRGG
jgi:hypothetical protein